MTDTINSDSKITSSLYPSPNPADSNADSNPGPNPDSNPGLNPGSYSGPNLGPVDKLTLVSRLDLRGNKIHAAHDIGADVRVGMAFQRGK